MPVSTPKYKDSFQRDLHELNPLQPDITQPRDQLEDAIRPECGPPHLAPLRLDISPSPSVQNTKNLFMGQTSSFYS